MLFLVAATKPQVSRFFQKNTYCSTTFLPAAIQRQRAGPKICTALPGRSSKPKQNDPSTRPPLSRLTLTRALSMLFSKTSPPVKNPVRVSRDFR